MNKSFFLYIYLIISYFNFILSKCEDKQCANNLVKHYGDYVECDMCVCDELCSLKRDDEFYDCFVKVILIHLIYSYLFFLLLTIIHLIYYYFVSLNYLIHHVKLN